MQSEILSQAAGCLTLFFMVSSYFCQKKSGYLLYQMLGVCAMFFSYLFSGEYFAMIALTVSFSRTVCFLIYEKRDKEAPLALAVLFAVLTVAAYLTVNLVILKTAKYLDILYLTAQAMYAFVFRIRNIRLVRFVITIPHVFAIVYNFTVGGMLFVALSYSFEFLANVYAIYRNRKGIGEAG